MKMPPVVGYGYFLESPNHTPGMGGKGVVLCKFLGGGLSL